MEDEFEKLKKQGKNSVDGLVQWLKDSKICDNTKEAEERVRKLFVDVADASNVELSKFKEALEKLAKEQHKNIEELVKSLAAEGPKILNAFAAGASAFKEALKGKKEAENNVGAANNQPGTPKKVILNHMDKKQLMENAFNILKSQGRNTADGLLSFLRERNILDESTEKIAKHALSAVPNQGKINLEKFTEVFESVAKGKGIDMGNIAKSVAAQLFPESSAPAARVVPPSTTPAESPPSAPVDSPPTAMAEATTSHSDDTHESDHEHHESDHEHHESDHDQESDHEHESDNDENESNDGDHDSDNDRKTS